MPVHEWTIAVLFPVQVTQEPNRVVRVTVVQVGICFGTDHDHGIGAVPDNNIGKTEQRCIQQGFLLADRIQESPYQAACQQQQEEDKSRIEGKARSEERREGKEGVRTCSSRGSPYTKK